MRLVINMNQTIGVISVIYWEVTSVVLLTRPVCVVRADSLQRMLLLPQAVHTLVTDGGEGALHELTVC